MGAVGGADGERGVEAEGSSWAEGAGCAWEAVVKKKPLAVVGRCGAVATKKPLAVVGRCEAVVGGRPWEEARGKAWAEEAGASSWAVGCTPGGHHV